MTQHDQQRTRGGPRVGLAGRFAWRVERRDGTIREQGKQNNLITDAGLDVIGDYGPHGVMRWLRVGDDSTTPAVADTSLGNEIAAGNPGSGSGSEVGVGQAEWTVTHDFGFDGATGNLTEFGASATQAGSLFSRALFEDGSGNPTTVTVQSNEKLVLTYTLELTVSPTKDAPGTGTVDITNVGSNLGFSYGVNNEFPELIRKWMSGSGLIMARHIKQGTGGYSSLDNIGSSRKSVTPEAYVAGSYQRVLPDVTFGTGEENATHYGYAISHEFTDTYACAFDAGDEFVKENTHELTITPPILSWGRA